jgi:hypothetical protein
LVEDTCDFAWLRNRNRKSILVFGASLEVPLHPMVPTQIGPGIGLTDVSSIRGHQQGIAAHPFGGIDGVM